MLLNNRAAPRCSRAALIFAKHLIPFAIALRPLVTVFPFTRQQHERGRKGLREGDQQVPGRLVPHPKYD
jgi:hypothetical protein